MDNIDQLKQLMSHGLSNKTACKSWEEALDSFEYFITVFRQNWPPTPKNQHVRKTILIHHAAQCMLAAQSVEELDEQIRKG